MGALSGEAGFEAAVEALGWNRAGTLFRARGTMRTMMGQARRSSRPLLFDADANQFILSHVFGPWFSIRSVSAGGANLARRLVTLSQALELLGPGPFVYALAGEGEDEGLRASSPTPPNPVQRTFQLIRLERDDIMVVVIYAATLGVLSLAVPIAVQSLVNTVAFGSLLQPLIVLAALLGIALFSAFYIRALQVRVVEMLQRRVFVRVVTELGALLPRIRSDAFLKANGPELLNRFFDVFTAQKTVASLVLGGIDAILIVVVGMVVLAFYHPILLAFDLGLIVTAFAVFVVAGRGGVKSAVKESKSKYAVAGWLEDMARSPGALKIFGGQHYAQARVEELATEYLNERDQHFKVVYRQILGTLAMEVVASVSLLVIGGALVIERQLTLGQLVAAELIVTAVVASIAKLGGKIETFYDLAAAVDKLGVILDLPTESASFKRGSPALSDDDPLRIKGLEHSELPVPLSFELRQGEMRSMYNLPCSAKAYVSDILFGLRDVPPNTISLGGWPSSDFGLRDWRATLAMSRGDEWLSASVAENLDVGDRSLGIEEQWHVLEMVGLAEKLRRLPEGLDTQVPPSGPLNDVERKQVALARAIASGPRFLVLDGVLDQFPPLLRSHVSEKLSATGFGVLLLSQNDRPQGC